MKKSFNLKCVAQPSV